MACNMNKIAHFSKEKQELVALCIDQYTNDLANFVSENAKTDDATIDAQIRSRFQNEILGNEEFNYRTYRKHKNEIFEIIEVILDQTLPEGWRENEFFNRFVEERRVDLGDLNEFYAEDNTYFSVSKFSGNHWDTNRERFDIGAPFSVATSWYDVHFYNEFERFMKNLDSFTKMLDKARKSFLNYFQNAIYTAFSGLSGEVPSDFVGSGTLSSDTEKAAFLAIADRVRAATGNSPIIVGTAAALRKLMGSLDTNWIAESSKDARNKTGVVPYFEGFELLVIPQVLQENSFDFAIGNDKILLISNGSKPIKFVFEGNSRMKEVGENTANRDQTLEYQIQTKAGVGIVVDQVYGYWTLT